MIVDLLNTWYILGHDAQGLSVPLIENRSPQFDISVSNNDIHQLSWTPWLPVDLCQNMLSNACIARDSILRLRRQTHESVDEICAADDTDNFSLSDDRQPLNSLLLHQ